MIITLISLAVIVTGIIFVVISEKTYTWDTSFVGWILVVIGIAFNLFTLGFIINNATTRELNYQNTVHEKEMLEYRIEKSNEDIVGNEMFYNDIVKFNNALRNTKKWANNPWTNWFNNQDIASIDYVELSD